MVSEYIWVHIYEKSFNNTVQYKVLNFKPQISQLGLWPHGERERSSDDLGIVWCSLFPGKHKHGGESCASPALNWTFLVQLQRYYFWGVSSNDSPADKSCFKRDYSLKSNPVIRWTLSRHLTGTLFHPKIHIVMNSGEYLFSIVERIIGWNPVE